MDVLHNICDFSQEQYITRLTRSNLSLRCARQELRWMISESHQDLNTLRSWVDRRCTGEPLARILGHIVFRELNIRLHPHVFEPRPETEELVDHVLPCLSCNDTCVEVGVGTGAVMLSLLQEGPRNLQVIGIDICELALANAQENARHHNFLEQCQWWHMSYTQINWSHVACDLLVSNPPYIAQNIMKNLPSEVTLWDPQAALYGGVDGLDPYKFLIEHAACAVRPGGWMWFEHGTDQQEDIKTLFDAHGFINFRGVKDRQGHNRCAGAQKNL